MTADEFVECFLAEKNSMLDLYTAPGSESAVSAIIRKMNLSSAQRESMRFVLDGVLTDAFYTILLALDGAASLGNVQQRYSVRDESGVELTDELEGRAWAAFHGGKREA